MPKEMRDDTHSLIIAGKEFIAFADGVPDRCSHDDNGEWLHFNNDGEYFKNSESPKDPEAWSKWAEAHNIVGGCCSCSKCGKPFTPDFYSMP